MVDEPDLLFAAAGLVFVAGIVLLARYDERWLWTGGAILQAFFIWAYIGIAGDRDPAYEFWGVAIRVVQVLLLVALAYLALRPVPEEAHEPLYSGR